MSGIGRALTCDEVRDLAAGFVLGILEPDEADAMRAHLAGCADPHTEIAELASGIPALWETTELVEPPAPLKSRILAAASADLATAESANPAPNPVTRVVAPTPMAEQTAPIPLAEHAARATGSASARTARSSFRPSLQWAAALAAVLVIALLGAWNVSLQGQVESLRTGQESLAAVVRAGALTGALTAILRAPGGAGGPSGLAALTPDGHLVLAMRDLPPTSGAHVYQAWVILPGSAPTPTGGFQVGEGGVGSIPATNAPRGPGAVVAITLESGPGATTPTLPILGSGTAVAQTN